MLGIIVFIFGNSLSEKICSPASIFIKYFHYRFFFSSGAQNMSWLTQRIVFGINKTPTIFYSPAGITH